MCLKYQIDRVCNIRSHFRLKLQVRYSDKKLSVNGLKYGFCKKLLGYKWTSDQLKTFLLLLFFQISTGQRFTCTFITSYEIHTLVHTYFVLLVQIIKWSGTLKVKVTLRITLINWHTFNLFFIFIFQLFSFFYIISPLCLFLFASFLCVYAIIRLL